MTEYHPKLDLYALAEWIHRQTHDGVFAETVDLVERLHDTGFEAAHEALEKGEL